MRPRAPAGTVDWLWGVGAAELLDQPNGDSLDHRFLGRKIIMQRRDVDAGATGDVARAQILEPVLGNQLVGGASQLAPPVACLSHRAPRSKQPMLQDQSVD